MSFVLTTLDFVVIAVYVAVLLGIGFFVSFRRKHSEDLFLAGRRLGWFNIGLSIYGTNVGPGMMIAACSVGYASGMVAANFEWLAWWFLMLLAMVFMPHYLNTKISTMPEFLSRRFSESCRHFLSWYTLVAILIIWVGGTLYAGGLLLNQVTGWPLLACIVALLIISTSFTVAGGLEAVVVTDAFQAVLMILASTALTVMALVHVGDLGRLGSEIPDGFWQLFPPAGDETYPWPAIVLGYPVLGVWFWCTDQTIVQRVLGGRNLRQGQYGTVFAAFLKIGTPLIFFLPGILCRVLYPNLEDSDQAYIKIVTEYFPHGMIGLVVSVMMAALVSTVDSGLNSLSTIFTLDVYRKLWRPQAETKEIILVGRVVTVLGAVFSLGGALAYMAVKDMDLFSLGQSMLAFLAPPLSAVFLVGVLMPRATARAAFVTLVAGACVNITLGVMYLAHWPNADFWPHFLLLSFYLFAAEAVFMILLSLVTRHAPSEHALPSIAETYRQLGTDARPVWRWWGVVAVIMILIYVFLQTR